VVLVGGSGSLFAMCAIAIPLTKQPTSANRYPRASPLAKTDMTLVSLGVWMQHSFTPTRLSVFALNLFLLWCVCVCVCVCVRVCMFQHFYVQSLRVSIFKHHLFELCALNCKDL